MTQESKTDKYYTGMVILVLMILGIFTFSWWLFRYPSYQQSDALLFFFPFIVGSVVFILLGTYIMHSEKRTGPTRAASQS